MFCASSGNVIVGSVPERRNECANMLKRFIFVMLPNGMVPLIPQNIQAVHCALHTQGALTYLSRESKSPDLFRKSLSQ